MHKQTKKIIKQNRKVYNTIAPYFSRTREYLWDELKTLSQYTKEGDKVLDLGCGNGRLYQVFKDLSRVEYTGLDQSKKLIKIARQKFPDVEFKLDEITKLPFVDQCFDIIYCIAVFNHLPDQETRLQSLQEMKRVLKKGGLIIMTNWNLHSTSVQKIVAKGKFKQEGSDFLVPWMTPEGKVLGERFYHAFTLDELKDLFVSAGFEVVDQYYEKKGKRSDIKEGFNIVGILRNKK